MSILQLTEPVVQAMIRVLEAGLPGEIETLNETVEDGFTLDPIAQYLPYMPFAAALMGGLPLVAVQRLGVEFQDELQSSSTGLHQYAVCVVVQNADHQALSLQLERMLQAVANVIHQDRIQPAGIMRTAGAWDVEMLRVEPGPLLGDFDPNAPSEVPHSYLSWAALVLSSKTEEV